MISVVAKLLNIASRVLEMTLESTFRKDTLRGASG
jgi:hypothetical protein